MRLATLLAVLAEPVAADMRVTRSECTGSWSRLVDLVFAPLSQLMVMDTDRLDEERKAFDAVGVGLTPDGWCFVEPGPFGALVDTDFEEVRWRADGLDAFANGTGLPSGLQLRLTGGDAGPSDAISYIALTLGHLPDEGLLIVEQLDLGHPNDTPIAVTAVLGGAYFDDIGSAMMAVGGLSLQKFAATVETTPALIAELAPDLTASLLESTVAGLSFGQLDRADRRAVLDFAGALPDATGLLSVELTSERGLGMIQIGMAGTKDGAEAVRFALSGATVGVDWTPE